MTPLKFIRNSLATRVCRTPQFQVFRPVIVADTVFMMHRFVSKQFATDSGLHHNNVFKSPYWPARAENANACVPVLRDISTRRIAASAGNPNLVTSLAPARHFWIFLSLQRIPGKRLGTSTVTTAQPFDAVARCATVLFLDGQVPKFQTLKTFDTRTALSA